jgi:catechol 2,3-dioxygenase-like lactoylglutathione lyase family enzyme
MSAVPTLEAVALDCPDPVALAEFYRELLDWGPAEVVDGGRWVDLPNPSGGVGLGFQRADDYRPPAWPSPDSPQQAHLDLEVADMASAQERALAIGAKLLDDSSDGFHVFADPAGHPFCLCVRG